jgi:hypothetical protein
MTKIICFAFSLLALVGCTSMRSAVTDRAAFDLHCPKEQITVSDIGSDGYGAEGCGKRTSYVCLRDGWGGLHCRKDSESLEKSNRK